MFGGTCTPSKVCFFVPSMAVLASHQQLLDLLRCSRLARSLSIFSRTSAMSLLKYIDIDGKRIAWRDLLKLQCAINPNYQLDFAGIFFASI